ncbi:MotE family protein [Fulvimarina sp. MAC8]|uniref:MotE family protein n=1 Tax=Fulvimarina sp. MAC8 TaxID=3162874 RepID=UPI0032EC1D54
MIARPNVCSSLLLALAMTASVSVSSAALAAGKNNGMGITAPVNPVDKVRIVDETDGHEKVEEEKPMSEVERYCLNIADKAQDARHALQAKQLKDIETEITAKIDELETRRAEYQEWIKERKAFLDNASTIVVDIYAQMAPDMAAPQLAKLGKESAAMILVRLKPRQASDVLAEMEPDKAAEIAKLIVEKTSTDVTDDTENQTVAENAS